MLSRIFWLGLFLGCKNLWASPFEMQLMAVPIQGTKYLSEESASSIKYVFPKFSNETEGEALQHYFNNLKLAPTLVPLVPSEFRGILGEGRKFQTVDYRSRVLLLANADYHHRLESEDLKIISQTIQGLGRQVFALPVSSMTGLNLEERKKFLSLLRKNFGVIIPLGGADIHFSLYGKTASRVDGAMNLQRDLDEASVVSAFIYKRSFNHTTAQESRGIIAICRGCQELAVILGYELIRDIPTEIPKSLNHQKSHLVQLVPTIYRLHESSVAPLVKGEKAERGMVQVFSRHHQARKINPGNVGRGLLLAAVASDRIPEAFETDMSMDLGPGVATQYHPEYGSPEFRRRFFNNILNSCHFLFNVVSPQL